VAFNVNNCRAGSDGHAVFYGQETPERVAFHKSQAMGNRLTNINDIAPLVVFLAEKVTGYRQTIFANAATTTR